MAHAVQANSQYSVVYGMGNENPATVSKIRRIWDAICDSLRTAIEWVKGLCEESRYFQDGGLVPRSGCFLGSGFIQKEFELLNHEGQDFYGNARFTFPGGNLNDVVQDIAGNPKNLIALPVLIHQGSHIITFVINKDERTIEIYDPQADVTLDTAFVSDDERSTLRDLVTEIQRRMFPSQPATVWVNERKLQHDKHNCGAWVIKIISSRIVRMRLFEQIQGEGLPEDIEAFRRRELDKFVLRNQGRQLFE